MYNPTVCIIEYALFRPIGSALVDQNKVPGPWSLTSWRQKPIKQQPTYGNAAALADVLNVIRTYPPLVFVGEVDNLKRQLADAAAGRRFLLRSEEHTSELQSH